MINGILNIYKEPGMTSFQVVSRVRRIVGEKKCGHTGTLDPDAEGVLPICLGRATKIVEYLTDRKKTYRAELKLGITTDTQDASGQVLETKDPSYVTEEAFRLALSGFEGDQLQIPPMVSALKVDGRRLYELARQGVTVERKARPVTFYSIQIVNLDLPRAEIEVTCSKGTYIRTLIHDLGQKLGCGACMTHLVRTAVGDYKKDQALRLSELEKVVEEGRLEQFLEGVDHFFKDLTEYHCRQEEDKIVHNGSFLQLKESAERLRVYDSRGKFIGIYKKTESVYKPEKMFYAP
ncbi:MAG: tRNA pseudouridine(55) synthase TruB [Eubacterium sp.]|nr:tRNA pseudouridine(55) synthase TruB [Eubacterium sp.]